MIFSKFKNLKSLIILLVLIFSFTLLILFFYKEKENSLIYTNVDLNKKHLIDITGDGEKETIEILNKDNLYDIKITTTDSTILLSSLLPDKEMCSSDEGNIFKIRFINISRDNKPEILVQGIKNNSTINYVFSYNQKFKLILSDTNNICGVIDSNMVKTPQFITLNYSEKKENLKSHMLINNEIINSTRNTTTVPGLDNIISLIDYINLEVEIDSHPEVFTDNISSNDLSQLWKLDKDNFKYTFKDSFFFDSTLDDKGNIIECTYILSFTKQNKKDNSIAPFDIDVKLIKDYYNTLKISEMRFFSQK